MFENFDQIIVEAKKKKEKTVCFADASDDKILKVVEELKVLNLCKITLVGDNEKTAKKACALGINLEDINLVNCSETEKLGVTAVKEVSEGRADVFVKGHMNSSDFLRAVLNKEVGLRTGAKLSTLTCYDVPDFKKLFFITDGGMVVLPTLEDKKAILTHSVNVLKSMGIKEPKVAILSSNEKVSEKIPSTVDAAKLCEMAKSGELPKAIYEGPISFDVAMRPDAAEEKGIESKVTGDVDLFLVPNIETGNCLGKSIGYFGKCQTAGIVIGAAKPVVLSSRAASVKGKITSIAWALLATE